MITIIIHGPRRSGKTAVAHAIRRELARLQATVVIKDDCGDIYAEQNAQKIVASKKPQVLIKIVDLEAPRIDDYDKSEREDLRDVEGCL